MEAIKIINAKDYGILPNTNQDYALNFIELAKALKEIKSPKKLVFLTGTYNIHYTNAEKRVIYISNTMGEGEMAIPERTIGIGLTEIENLEIEGNNSVIVLHGNMINLLLEHCKNITVKNLAFDYSRPSVSEMQVESIQGATIRYKVNSLSTYTIQGNRLFWYGDNFKYDSHEGNMVCWWNQVCKKDEGITYRRSSPFAYAIAEKEVGDRLIEVNYLKKIVAEVGDIFQLRDPKRTAVGTFIHDCNTIVFDNIKQYFMHGLGIVGQLSENLSFNKLWCAVPEGTDRTTAGFADFMHFVMCKGKIKISNSYFNGSHDDVINIHGINFKVIEAKGSDKILVKFMEKQAYGFNAFKPGDKLDMVDIPSLTSRWIATVKSSRMLDKYVTEIELTAPIGSNDTRNLVVENISRIAEAEITNNEFHNIPTRGILLTTRGKTVISGNLFQKTGMAGILVADDARNWYESGMVRDLTIKNNIFNECGGAATVLILPENSKVSYKKPVHKNIKIVDNTFNLNGNIGIYAKSTQNLQISGNKFNGETCKRALIELLGCSDIEIKSNDIATNYTKIKARKCGKFTNPKK